MTSSTSSLSAFFAASSSTPPSFATAQHTQLALSSNTNTTTQHSTWASPALYHPTSHLSDSIARSFPHTPIGGAVAASVSTPSSSASSSALPAAATSSTVESAPQPAAAAHNRAVVAQYRASLKNRQQALDASTTPSLVSGSAAAATLSTMSLVLDEASIQSCHQCKTAKAAHQLLHCTRSGNIFRKRRCRKKYCFSCLARSHSIAIPDLSDNDVNEWNCPSCNGTCPCPTCVHENRVKKLSVPRNIHNVLLPWPTPPPSTQEAIRLQHQHISQAVAQARQQVDIVHSQLDKLKSSDTMQLLSTNASGITTRSATKAAPITQVSSSDSSAISLPSFSRSSSLSSNASQSPSLTSSVSQLSSTFSSASTAVSLSGHSNPSTDSSVVTSVTSVSPSARTSALRSSAFHRPAAAKIHFSPYMRPQKSVATPTTSHSSNVQQHTVQQQQHPHFTPTDINAYNQHTTALQYTHTLPYSSEYPAMTAASVNVAANTNVPAYYAAPPSQQAVRFMPMYDPARGFDASSMLTAPPPAHMIYGSPPVSYHHHHLIRDPSTVVHTTAPVIVQPQYWPQSQNVNMQHSAPTHMQFAQPQPNWSHFNYPQ